jgi:hypothetical protein
MNAAIQCLSNTRELRDYFLSKKSFSDYSLFLFHSSIESYYLSELNRTNPLGMKGAMAEEFGIVIKNLWNDKFPYTFADRLRVSLMNITYSFIHIELFLGLCS